MWVLSFYPLVLPSGCDPVFNVVLLSFYICMIEHHVKSLFLTDPRSDECDGSKIRENFFRFNNKFWIVERPQGPKSASTMQIACQKHNASLFAIDSENLFEQAVTISSKKFFPMVGHV